jgi:hypothetical protein
MRSSFLKITGALALIAVVAACGATAPPRQTSSRAEPAKGGYDFKSEGRIPAPAGGSAQPQADVEEIAVGDTSLDVSEADAPRDSTPPASPVVADSTADGFRIQVFASADRDVAQNARSVAAERLGIPAYLDLDAGVYKVRVGDYLRRDDAAAALPSVRAQYYPDAWVVPARINVPRSR